MMLYPETEEEKQKLIAEAKAKARLKKIERMHAINGPGPIGRQCKDCKYLVGYRQSATWYKCEAYGSTKGPSTDWRVRWLACGKFEEAKA